MPPGSGIWECKIGEVDPSILPNGSDYPMRQAIKAAYRELTGHEPEFIFSGWGATLNAGERDIVEADRHGPQHDCADCLREWNS